MNKPLPSLFITSYNLLVIITLAYCVGFYNPDALKLAVAFLWVMAFFRVTFVVYIHVLLFQAIDEIRTGGRRRRKLDDLRKLVQPKDAATAGLNLLIGSLTFALLIYFDFVFSAIVISAVHILVPCSLRLLKSQVKLVDSGGIKTVS